MLFLIVDGISLLMKIKKRQKPAPAVMRVITRYVNLLR